MVIMALTFIWDESKNADNIKKHGLSFEQAIKIFSSDFVLEYDHEHSTISEDRYKSKGFVDNYGYILVVHCEPFDNVYRIISARKI